MGRTHFSGVAGWLGLLVAWLILISPLSGLTSTRRYFDDAERLYPQIIKRCHALTLEYGQSTYRARAECERPMV